jgi:hypothetical protein
VLPATQSDRELCVFFATISSGFGFFGHMNSLQSIACSRAFMLGSFFFFLS